MAPISYKWNSSKAELSIALPDKIVFDFEFLKMTAKMLHLINKFPCEIVTFMCNNSADYDKLSKAYLYNLLLHVAGEKKARWNLTLKSKIELSVHSKTAANFEPIDNLAEKIRSSELNFYRFTGDAGIDTPVNALTKLLVEKNVTLDPEKIKEFLATTIGEIFSNSISHSAQDEFFFMFDVVYDKVTTKFQMYVNIIDYGKTIAENVNSFFRSHSKPSKTSSDCIDWAIKPGNTTRSGSGGYGLPTLIEYIKEVHGDLFIFSGNAYYRLENGREEINDNSDGVFNGTSVTFRVALLDSENALCYDPTLKKVHCVSLENI